MKPGRLTISTSVTLAIGLMASQGLAAPLYECPRLEARAPGAGGYDTMTQGEDGWVFRNAADLGWQFSVSDEISDTFGRLNAALELQGANLAMLAIPPRGLTDYEYISQDNGRGPILTKEEGAEFYRQFLDQFRAADIIAPDVLSAAEALDTDFFFKRDFHWRPEGARATASLLAQDLAERPFFAERAPVPHTLEKIRSRDFKNTMGQIISRFCDEPIPAEPYDEFEARRTASDSDDLGLFGDSDEFSVSLLGSSFSATANFSFTEFLAHELQAEVANHAISGGQHTNAAISYFSSPTFAEAKPDLIVWESPVYYDFNGASVDFRQMIPAVGGVCAPENALAEEQLTFDGNSVEIALSVKPAGDGQPFVYVEVDNAALVQLAIEFRAQDGERESVGIDRSERFNNFGRYFLETSQDMDSPLQAVTISSPQALSTEMQVRICPGLDLSAPKAG